MALPEKKEERAKLFEWKLTDTTEKSSTNNVEDTFSMNYCRWLLGRVDANF
ncbi:hypothetical protein FACS189443_4650 [Planctomycetales bacterium]|nr:hypothetical protein FACS189443_4650 [Planctomycetales bacterium]